MKDAYYLDPRVAAAYDTETVMRDDIPFYVALAKECADSGLPVLELGCGTGRVTLPVAEAGVAVVGLDASPAMLDVARGKSVNRENPRWIEADMADFHLEERFGLVVIPARSFLLLLTVAEQKACLGCIHEHLVPGGRLALNIFNPDLVLMASWMTAKRGLWRREETNDAARELLASTKYRTATQEIDEQYLEHRFSDDGAIIARAERNLRVRYVFRYEMEHLLTLSGFEVEALYGWFDGRLFDDESSEIVWVARRR
jgi:SAM-dependent methyltransferase